MPITQKLSNSVNKNLQNQLSSFVKYHIRQWVSEVQKRHHPGVDALELCLFRTYPLLKIYGGSENQVLYTL